MIESLSLALVITLGLAIRFYVRARKAERNLEWTRAHFVRLLDEEERTVDRLCEKLSDMTRKRDDAWTRYLDSLDEIAAMKAESDRGPEAA